MDYTNNGKSINLNDSVSPAIILDESDDNLFFVLMPMRI